MKTLVISLPCEVTPDLISRITAVFHEYASTHHKINDVYALAFSEFAAVPAEELPPEPEPEPEVVPCDTCGYGPCECDKVDAGILGRKYNGPEGPRGHPGIRGIPSPDGSSLPSHAYPPFSEPEPEPLVSKQAKVLTLSTTLEVTATVNPAVSNSQLFVSRVSSSEDVIRFDFNGFEHALPQVRDAAGDPSLKNPQHECGDSTVRVVVELDKKTYPCLVDVCPFEGESQEAQLPFLVIGNDLMSELEVTNNVPSE